MYHKLSPSFLSTAVRGASVCSLHLAYLLKPLQLSQLCYFHSAKMKTTGICLSCLPTASFKAKKDFDACAFLDQYLVVVENFLDMTRCINSGLFFPPFLFWTLNEKVICSHDPRVPDILFDNSPAASKHGYFVVPPSGGSSFHVQTPGFKWDCHS